MRTITDYISLFEYRADHFVKYSEWKKAHYDKLKYTGYTLHIFNNIHSFMAL